MKCRNCGRHAVARIHVRIEVVDLAQFPAELMEFADVEETGGMCIACMHSFVDAGREAAVMMEDLEERAPVAKPLPN